MSLFAQKSRPEMVATIYGSSQAQLSERLGSIHVLRRTVLKSKEANYIEFARGNRYKKAPLLRGSEFFATNRSGHAHAFESVTPVRLCSPLALTSA